MSELSRIAKLPISVPAGVTITFDQDLVTVKGPKGSVSQKLLVDGVTILMTSDGREAQVVVSRNGLKAFSGTVAAILKNLIYGVTQLFEKKLELVGVGYRAQVQGKVLNLTLGFSHPVTFSVPDTITIETPTQTEILVKGANKDLVGLTAARIRAYRKPEPYKGKGVRYAGEIIKIKETKKK
jgi:large subunit ribosomal protein L6